jgi:hypothetical protein
VDLLKIPCGDIHKREEPGNEVVWSFAVVKYYSMILSFKMMHFSEAFFVHELPWKSLLNVTDSRYNK